MGDVFLYGTLCHAPLRAAVLGVAVEGVPAVVPDHAVRRAAGQPFALILPEPGAAAAGLLLRDPGEAAMARLGWYAAARGFEPVTVPVAQGGVATAFAPRPGLCAPGGAWSLDDWLAREGAVVTATAPDVMRLMGKKPAEALRARMPQMLVRGAARLRAAAARPVSVGFVPAPGDVVPLDWAEPYAAFFAVEEHRLSHRRFDGRMGEPIGRAVFVSADAVTVLPYDPARDRVLLIEQFRAAPWARGDARPWLLEAIAGRIDPFETAEEAARREAAEEAGLTLGALHPVAEYYPSPGAKTECLWSYVGIADLPDGAGGLGGLEGEGEDIRAHVMTFDALMALIDRGEAANGPLILSAWWLARHRERLRAAQAGG
jgi:nudix-type nucleoside diphosphatase (YffH/AdpP family)